MVDLRRVVLDVLKPHEPTIMEFTERLATADGVDGITASLIELDQEVQNVEIAFEGDPLDYEAIEHRIEALGGSIHSVDQVAFGQYLVEDQRGHRDD